MSYVFILLYSIFSNTLSFLLFLSFSITSVLLVQQRLICSMQLRYMQAPVPVCQRVMSESKQSAGFGALVRKFFHRTGPNPEQFTPLSNKNGTITSTKSVKSGNSRLTVETRAQDDASVLTLASSSKQRRRSLDTNASIQGVLNEPILSQSVSVASQRSIKSPTDQESI